MSRWSPPAARDPLWPHRRVDIASAVSLLHAPSRSALRPADRSAAAWFASPCRAQGALSASHGARLVSCGATAVAAAAAAAAAAWPAAGASLAMSPAAAAGSAWRCRDRRPRALPLRFVASPWRRVPLVGFRGPRRFGTCARAHAAAAASETDTAATVAAVKRPHATHYQVLDLPSSASKQDIKTAFYKLSMVYHPDRAQGDAAAHNAIFLRVNEAYTTLSDDRRRKDYDYSLPSAHGDGGSRGSASGVGGSAYGASGDRYGHPRPPPDGSSYYDAWQSYRRETDIDPDDWILWRDRGNGPRGPRDHARDPGSQWYSHRNMAHGPAAYRNFDRDYEDSYTRMWNRYTKRQEELRRDLYDQEPEEVNGLRAPILVAILSSVGFFYIMPYLIY